MFSSASLIITDYHIDSIDERDSFEGQVLKSTWVKGPGPATKDKGRVDIGAAKEDNKQQEPNKNDNNQSEVDKKNSSSSETESSKGGNENLIRTYSIYEAFNKLRCMYEDEYTIPKGAQTTLNAPANPHAADNMYNMATSDKRDKPKEDPKDQPKNDTKEKPKEEPKQKEEPKKDPKEEPKKEDSFKLGEEITLQVGIENEGWTEWTIAVDARADINAVKNLISSMKFKEAYDKACENTDTDGLVPKSAITRVCKKTASDAQPPFISHCGYALGVGDLEDSAGDLQLTLAVAPYNAVKKDGKSEKTVIKATYNIKNIETFAGSTLDKAAAAVKDFAKDTASKISGVGNDRNYGRDSFSSDSYGNNDELAKAINDSLKNKFGKLVGNHEQYDNFFKMSAFIKNHIKDKSIELESVSVGNDRGATPLNKDKVPAFNGTFAYY